VKKITTEEFIKRSKIIHGDKYDYSETVYVNSNTPIKIICPEHGVFEKKPNKHIHSKQGCPKCSNRKLTTNDFIVNGRKIHGDKYDYSLVDYKDNKSKVKIICPEHGVFEKSYLNHVINKQGCPQCSYDKLSTEKTLSQDVVLKRFKLIHGDKYDYSKVIYKNINENVTIICPVHGEFIQTPNNHLKKYGCPKCLTKVNDLDSFIYKSKSIFGDSFDYSQFEYNGIFNKSTLRCKKHDNVFSINPNNHLYSRFGGCSKCLEDSKRVAYGDFISQCRVVHKNFYDYTDVAPDDYDGITRTKIKIRCPEHGIFKQSIFDHYTMGNGCPKCGNKKSRLEDFIENLLKKYNITYEQHCLTILKTQELDFYLPEHSVAVEVNGLRYHSEAVGKKDKNYHLNKTKECEKLGIRLVHIFEDEIVHKPRIVENKLKNVLKYGKKPLYARKCEVREISGDVKNIFLDKYHSQGKCTSSVNLGLFYNNHLVSVMTFAPPSRKTKNYMLEFGYYDLNRYCGNFNFYVIGGASKMLKYFERNYKPKKIISFAEKTWSQGELYYKLGFSFDYELPPDYKVTTGCYPYITYHKSNFKKDSLAKKLNNFDPDLSEWGNLLANGYDRIWDCGKIKFIKVLDKS